MSRGLLPITLLNFTAQAGECPFPSSTRTPVVLDSPFSVVTLIMRIEFDEAKHAATLKARGLDMARAEEVFADATLTVEDDRQDYGEVRYITIGFLDQAMVVLVWTHRDDAHRIISMRRANERERRLYGPRF